jgi:hypothetical protein
LIRLETFLHGTLNPETNNVVEDAHPGEGYTNIVEYIPIGHPTPTTLSKIAAITPSTHFGDREF